MSRNKNGYIFAPQAQKRRSPGCLILGLAILFAAIVLAVLVNISMNKQIDLRSEKVRVMSLDKTFENFTVLHLSDLHADALGLDPIKWKELLYGKSYSAVVMTGDMVGKSGDFSPFVMLIKTLRQLNESAPIFFIAGDDDPAPILTDVHASPGTLAEWVTAAQSAGAIYLDAPTAVQVGKRNVWFTPESLYSVDIAGMLGSLTRQKEEMEQSGRQYEGEGSASYRALCYRLDATDRASLALEKMTDKDLQIGVTHVPLTADYVRTMHSWADPSMIFNFRRLSLVLAGHYAGGQWRISALGPLYVPGRGWFPGDEGVTGMQRINSISQYISAGLGASGYYPMPGRLFNTPGATLLTFTAKLE